MINEETSPKDKNYFNTYLSDITNLTRLVQLLKFIIH